MHTHTHTHHVVNNTAGFYRFPKVQLQPLSREVQSFHLLMSYIHMHAQRQTHTHCGHDTHKNTQASDIVQEIRSIIAGVFSLAIEGG